jgi:hypothetical protein
VRLATSERTHDRFIGLDSLATKCPNDSPPKYRTLQGADACPGAAAAGWFPDRVNRSTSVAVLPIKGYQSIQELRNDAEVFAPLMSDFLAHPCRFSQSLGVGIGSRIH